MVLASIWNLIGTLSWCLLPGITEGRADAITALGLILTGWLMAWLTCALMRSRRIYVLTLAEIPVLLGGRLRGQLETNAPADVLAGYVQELRCQQLTAFDPARPLENAVERPARDSARVSRPRFWDADFSDRICHSG